MVKINQYIIPPMVAVMFITPLISCTHVIPTAAAITYSNQCTAVATDSKQQSTRQWDSSKSGAKTRAIAQCKRNTVNTGAAANSCEITAAHCTGEGPGNTAFNPQEDSVTMIQGCEFKKARALGYKSGSRHAYCLSKGWSGGHIEDKQGNGGNCWRSQNPNEHPEKSCPMIWRYYIKKDGMECEHIDDQIADILKVCRKG